MLNAFNDNKLEFISFISANIICLKKLEKHLINQSLSVKETVRSKLKSQTRGSCNFSDFSLLYFFCRRMYVLNKKV